MNTMKGRLVLTGGLIIILVVVMACFFSGCTSQTTESKNTASGTKAPQPVNTATFPTPDMRTFVPTLSESPNVKIQMNDFDPAILVVMNGTTVTWTNYDESMNYSVVSDNGTPESFKSGDLSKGKTFQFRFTRPGTYPYHSETISKISGKIIVQ